jgi:cytochrome P450
MARTGDRRMKLELVLPALPPPSPGFSSARRSWLGLIDQLIDEAKQDPRASSRVDLLSVCLRHGTKLSATALRHTMSNVFFGGVFSVTSVLVTSMYLLARNSTVNENLRVEVGDLVRRTPNFDRAGFESCVYLDAVLREAMRYYPPVPLYFRNVVPDRAIDFAGHTIPADTLLFVTNWFLHRESSHWQNPEQFDPRRWQAGGTTRDPLGSGYFFPFGRGPRTCLGLPFASFFMKLALTTLAAESSVDLDRSIPYVQDFFFGVMMPRGLKGSFRPSVV